MYLERNADVIFGKPDLEHLHTFAAFPVFMGCTSAERFTDLSVDMSTEIISAMFQRGAFGPANVATSAACLQIYALSIPFSCLFSVNGRACESFQRLLWPSIFGSVGNLLMIAFTFAFVASTGYIGIPLARLAIDSLYFLPLGFVAFHRFGGSLHLAIPVKTLATASTACVVPAVGFHWISTAGGTHSLWWLVERVGCFALMYGLTLALIDGHDVHRTIRSPGRGTGDPSTVRQHYTIDRPES